MDRRPPLAVSPRRLRPRPHRGAARPPVASSVQTPPGSIKKVHTPMRSSICTLPPPRPEPSPRVKLDFTAGIPTRAAKEKFEYNEEIGLNLAAAMNCTVPSSPLFERGRFYDLYSARRNERLKRKHGFLTEEVEAAAAKAIAEDPCIAVELSKRRSTKKVESVRRSMPVDFSVSRASSLRSSLRSSKEMKKSSAVSCAVKSSAAKERRISTRLSTRRI